MLWVCRITLCVCRVLLRQHLKCWWYLHDKAWESSLFLTPKEAAPRGSWCLHSQPQSLLAAVPTLPKNTKDNANIDPASRLVPMHIHDASGWQVGTLSRQVCPCNHMKKSRGISTVPKYINPVYLSGRWPINLILLHGFPSCARSAIKEGNNIDGVVQCSTEQCLTVHKPQMAI